MRCCSDCSCAQSQQQVHARAIKQAKTGECIVFASHVPEHAVGTVLRITHVWAGSAHVIHGFTALDGRLFGQAHDKDCSCLRKDLTTNITLTPDQDEHELPKVNSAACPNTTTYLSPQLQIRPLPCPTRSRPTNHLGRACSSFPPPC
jgi:hypothetical protein